MALVVALAAASCGGGGGQATSATDATPSTPLTTPAGITLTTRAGLDPSRPECSQLHLVVQGDLTDAQRARIEEILDSDPAVVDWTYDPPGEGNTATYRITPTDEGAMETIAGRFTEVEGVVTVLFPRQICDLG